MIQADEGPYPRLGTRFPASWAKEPAGDVRVKYGILNAYYLPGPRSEFIPYASITPVNTFRMIFNRYFGAQLAILPDTSYATADSRRRVHARAARRSRAPRTAPLVGVAGQAR